jgi:hypothetical protein
LIESPQTAPRPLLVTYCFDWIERLLAKAHPDHGVANAFGGGEVLFDVRGDWHRALLVAVWFEES